MVARRDISKEIAVARLKFLVAPGHRAGDFASPVHHRPIYNLVYRSVGYIPGDNSHVRFTPQAPLNHSGVCLCDLMFGQVLSGSDIRE